MAEKQGGGKKDMNMALIAGGLCCLCMLCMAMGYYYTNKEEENTSSSIDYSDSTLFENTLSENTLSENTQTFQNEDVDQYEKINKPIYTTDNKIARKYSNYDNVNSTNFYVFGEDIQGYEFTDNNNNKYIINENYYERYGYYIDNDNNTVNIHKEKWSKFNFPEITRGRPVPNIYLLSMDGESNYIFHIVDDKDNPKNYLVTDYNPNSHSVQNIKWELKNKIDLKNDFKAQWTFDTIENTNNIVLRNEKTVDDKFLYMFYNLDTKQVNCDDLKNMDDIDDVCNNSLQYSVCTLCKWTYPEKAISPEIGYIIKNSAGEELIQYNDTNHDDYMDKIYSPVIGYYITNDTDETISSYDIDYETDYETDLCESKNTCNFYGKKDCLLVRPMTKDEMKGDSRFHYGVTIDNDCVDENINDYSSCNRIEYSGCSYCLDKKYCDDLTYEECDDSMKEMCPNKCKDCNLITDDNIFVLCTLPDYKECSKCNDVCEYIKNSYSLCNSPEYVDCDYCVNKTYCDDNQYEDCNESNDVMSDCSYCEYKQVSSVSCVGDSILEKTVDNVKECMEMCSEQSDCKALVYDTDNVCNLYSSCDSVETTTNKNTYSKLSSVVKVATCHGITISDCIDDTGKDIDKYQICDICNYVCENGTPKEQQAECHTCDDKYKLSGGQCIPYVSYNDISANNAYNLFVDNKGIGVYYTDWNHYRNYGRGPGIYDDRIMKLKLIKAGNDKWYIIHAQSDHHYLCTDEFKPAMSSQWVNFYHLDGDVNKARPHKNTDVCKWYIDIHKINNIEHDVRIRSAYSTNLYVTLDTNNNRLKLTSNDKKCILKISN